MVHVPVMLNEVLHMLSPFEDVELVVDGTLGAGGHSMAILENCPNAFLIGIDQDESILAIAKDRLSAFKDRVHFALGNFRDIRSILSDAGFDSAQVFLFDLGISSLQVDSPERGFSFNYNGPLDMRMDMGRVCSSLTAADIVNTWSPAELTMLFRRYGEDPFAFQVARAICRRREKDGPIMTCEELVEVIRSAIPAPAQRKMRGHPARRIFQALRIQVNDEMGALEELLDQLPQIIRRGGKVIFITYHSLEDRMVKRTMRSWAEAGLGKPVTSRPMVPSEEELEINRRSRSAKVRCFLFDR
jgi:16S rRNA (cytosine1402-N4)-methyltransferase